MTLSQNNLIWIDLEMTGLDVQRDSILEIATIVTDNSLNILAEGPVFAIHQDETLLNSMDDWNKDHHGRSGLLERVRQSIIHESEAEEKTLNFLHQWVSEKSSPMCGNSIHQDRKFLSKYMPALEQYFHYRNLDVSTLKELTKRWAPQVARLFQKGGKHLALLDIQESIDELRFYRTHLFKDEFQNTQVNPEIQN